jgi:glycosyltransferase involved in cell wall biosynthesis
MPATIASLDLRDYDLTISFSHCVAKGFERDPAGVHVCYCFTPMRYVWTDVGDHEGRGGAAHRVLSMLAPMLRAWDYRSAANVDRFVANSRNVADRIWRCYGRDSDVVHSPVDTNFFTLGGTEAEREGYLVVSALTPYKRVEHAIHACGRLGRRLTVVGTGPRLEHLREQARRYNEALPGLIRFAGWCSDEKVREEYRRCRALLMPQEEDFGLTPLEAMACGAPVIAYGAGGALETVVDGVTGLIYQRQSPASLAEAIERFETLPATFDPATLRRHAEAFSTRVFDQRFLSMIADALHEKGFLLPLSTSWPGAKLGLRKRVERSTCDLVAVG